MIPWLAKCFLSILPLSVSKWAALTANPPLVSLASKRKRPADNSSSFPSVASGKCPTFPWLVKVDSTPPNDPPFCCFQVNKHITVTISGRFAVTLIYKRRSQSLKLSLAPVKHRPPPLPDKVDQMFLSHLRQVVFNLWVAYQIFALYRKSSDTTVMTWQWK